MEEIGETEAGEEKRGQLETKRCGSDTPSLESYYDHPEPLSHWCILFKHTYLSLPPYTY